MAETQLCMWRLNDVFQLFVFIEEILPIIMVILILNHFVVNDFISISQCASLHLCAVI